MTGEALACHHFVGAPLFFAREITRHCAVDSDDRAHRIADDVFFAVRSVDHIADD